MLPNMVHCGITFRNEWAKSRLKEISDQKFEKYSIKLLAYDSGDTLSTTLSSWKNVCDFMMVSEIPKYSAHDW